MERIHNISDSIVKSNKESPVKKQNRIWLNLKGATKYEAIRVMSYNLLAPSNIRKYMFPNHTTVELSKARRFQLLSTEILELKPDILCVQELDEADVELFTQTIAVLDLDVT